MVGFSKSILLVEMPPTIRK